MDEYGQYMYDICLIYTLIIPITLTCCSQPCRDCPLGYNNRLRSAAVSSYTFYVLRNGKTSSVQAGHEDTSMRGTAPWDT